MSFEVSWTVELLFRVKLCRVLWYLVWLLVSRLDEPYGLLNYQNWTYRSVDNFEFRSIDWAGVNIGKPKSNINNFLE